MTRISRIVKLSPIIRLKMTQNGQKICVHSLLIALSILRKIMVSWTVTKILKSTERSFPYHSDFALKAL